MRDARHAAATRLDRRRLLLSLPGGTRAPTRLKEPSPDAQVQVRKSALRAAMKNPHS